VVREHFRGKLTYCAIPLERIDWTPFDIMSIELIRSAEVADQFRMGVRKLAAQDKPLAITGFGTATWRGAADVAPRSKSLCRQADLMGVHQREPVTEFDSGFPAPQVGPPGPVVTPRQDLVADPGVGQVDIHGGGEYVEVGGPPGADRRIGECDRLRAQNVQSPGITGIR
jgi:hypothetical protein